MHLFLRKTLNLFLFASVIFFFYQCSDSKTSKLQFPKNRWYQFKTLTFNHQSNSSNEIRDIKFNITYVYGTQFSEIPLELYITNPLHQIEKIPITLHLLDENNNELGDCIGDYCDLQILLKEKYQFTENGKYKIQLMHKFDFEYLPNVLSVGLSVK